MTIWNAKIYTEKLNLSDYTIIFYRNGEEFARNSDLNHKLDKTIAKAERKLRWYRDRENNFECVAEVTI